MWLVSLAVVVILIMAAAAPHASQVPSVRDVNTAIGPIWSVSPLTLAGAVSLVLAGLLLLLFFYRRRLFILLWTSGWTVLAVSMFIAGARDLHESIRWMCYGFSQFLGIIAGLLLVLAADAYRSRPRYRRDYTLYLLPVLLWFTLAPYWKGSAAVFAPGHILIAGALAAAGIGHLLMLQHTRMLGAGVAGATLLVLAGLHGWVAVRLDSPLDPAMIRVVMTCIVLYLITAGGMQLMTFEDMTYELRRTNKKLETAQGKLRRMAITDALTGCRNRRFFDEIIARELQRHRRYGIPLSLLFVDIDQFKAINDTYGHDVGDEVLRQVAAFLLNNIREADYVFRWGGDEFLILISCPETEARRRGLALQEAFGVSPAAEGLPSEVRLSIGCAEVRDDAADVMSLVKVADGRMYENKRAVKAS